MLNCVQCKSFTPKSVSHLIFPSLYAVFRVTLLHRQPTATSVMTKQIIYYCQPNDSPERIHFFEKYCFYGVCISKLGHNTRLLNYGL